MVPEYYIFNSLFCISAAEKSLFAMMAQPAYYIFTCRDKKIPRHVTHVLIPKRKVVPAQAFYMHPNIVEVICHVKVNKIGREAFHDCPRLRRVIMPGVKEVERHAFYSCRALTYIECGKLERIGAFAFSCCESLSSIDLPSIIIVENNAFRGCWNLINAKFGKKLNSIRREAFAYCHSLERIAIPLNGVINGKSTFQGCRNLNHVDVVAGNIHKTISTLMEEWKNDMNDEIGAINRILPRTPPGNLIDFGGKANAIRAWNKSVHRKYNHYRGQHRHYLSVAALEPALPNDILFKNVLPFLAKSFGRG